MNAMIVLRAGRARRSEVGLFDPVVHTSHHTYRWHSKCSKNQVLQTRRRCRRAAMGGMGHTTMHKLDKARFVLNDRVDSLVVVPTPGPCAARRVKSLYLVPRVESLLSRLYVE